MTLIADAAAEVQRQAKPVRTVPGRSRGIGNWIVLLVAGIYFLLPLAAAAKFALTSATGGFSWSGITGITGTYGFTDAFTLTMKLALVTTIATLVLMVPTAVWVHLRLPRLRRLLDGLTLLPIVIPPIVLIVGVLQVAPGSLKATPYLLAIEYVVLAMPFAYRSLDNALQSFDLRTVFDAARSLGSGWFSTLWRVVLPNLRSGVLSATVLTVALVLGEYTMATLDQYQTFSVWIVGTDQDAPQVSVAASLLSLIATWLILLAISVIGGRRRRSKQQVEGES